MQFYEVNAPGVVFERFEDETVLIQLDSGRYYTLDRVGSLVWELLARPLAVGGVAAALARAFRTEPVAVEAAVRELIGQLEGEQLLRPRTDAAAGEPGDPTLEVPEGAAFAPPRLTRYDDMQEILLLDPVHDVDERGWPSAPGAQPGNGDGSARVVVDATAGAVRVQEDDVSEWPSLKESP
jgi:hypothetical protein